MGIVARIPKCRGATLAAVLMLRAGAAAVDLEPNANGARSGLRGPVQNDAASTATRSVCPDDAPQHSGMLQAAPGVQYFYWLAESRSKRPSDDPLILWMTGGPGCSSMLAALTENGPCKVVGRTKAGFVMDKRRWSWSEAANVVWVDQPAGVGFSSRPESASALARNESEVSTAMFGFLRSLYAKFPQYRHVPLYIFGESYAGHYVPAVAAKVLEEEGQQMYGMQLTGIGIGNGLVNPAQQFKSKPEMAVNGGRGGSLGGGVVGKATYAQMTAALPACITGIRQCEASNERDTRVCLNAYMGCMKNEMDPAMKTGLNPYDLRKECLAGTSLCYNESLEVAFMNDPAVQMALGAPRIEQWEACNNSVTNQFVQSGDYLMDLSPQVAELLAGGVAVLAYNGDDDYMVDWLGTRQWMSTLDWPHLAEWLHAPELDFDVESMREPAGLVKTARGLTFVQVYNAGHLVPMDQPEVALAMVQEFVKPGSVWRELAVSSEEAENGAAAPVTLGASAALVPASLAVAIAISFAAALGVGARGVCSRRRAALGVSGEARGDYYVSLG